MAGELGVKTIGVAAVALVLGFVLGGLGPSGKLRAAEDRIFELEKKVGRGDRAGTELARMIASGIRDSRGGSGLPSAPGAVLTDDTDAPRAPGSPLGSPDDDTDVASVEERQTSIETLKEGLALRARLARQGLIDEAGVTDAQLERIDQVYDAMNDDLLELTRRVSQVMQENGGAEPRRRDLLAFGAEGLATLADAEAQVLATLDADQRADVSDEATDPSSFIAPEVIDVFRQLDDAGDAP